ncbi:hypothetical protein LFM09_27840 [Lentzea alba]|uniref:hypothetical protein n=1 Tax=Lentzea alba TaxID=2714351 RepID=UPI0039BF449E
MTQPPQWGAPTPAPPMYHRLPQMPPRLIMACLLHGLFTVTLCVLGAFLFVARSMDGETLFWSFVYGASPAGFAVLNVGAIWGIYDPHFPQMITSRLSSVACFIMLAGALVRSWDREDVKIAPTLVVAAIMVLCVLNLFLTFGPQVKQWRAARHQLSLSQGLRPRR